MRVTLLLAALVLATLGDAENSVGIQFDVSYGASPWQKLDIYWLKEQGGKPMPRQIGILVVPGGGWAVCDKSDAGLKKIAATLAPRGATVAIMQYKTATSTVPSWPQAADDVTTALAWFRRLDFVDRSRVTVYGISAGGELALISAMQTPVACTVVANCAPVDLRAPYPIRAMDTYIDRFVGAGRVNARIEASPLLQLNPSYRSKTVLLQTDPDGMVSPAQTDEFYAALRAAGKNAQYVHISGLHAFYENPVSAFNPVEFLWQVASVPRSKCRTDAG